MPGFMDIAGGAGMGALSGGPVGAAIGGGLPLLQMLLGLGEGNAPPAPGLPSPGGFAQISPTQGQVSPGAKSAHGRTLESFYEGVEVTDEMPPPVQGVMPDIATAGAASMESPLTPTDAYATLAPPVDPTVAAMDAASGAAPIPGDLGGGGPMDMTGLEMAMLGLQLGSALFGGNQAPVPRPPSLPSSSFSPMRPMR